MLLEMGGDGLLIVLADADVDAAVDGAIVGCFYYSGQVCTSAERLLIHESVYDEFMDKFKNAILKLNIGDPASEDTDMGPLCNEATLQRVKQHVADALPHGSVNVNETTNYWDQLAPFGGAGRSGVGRELSQWFLDAFTEAKLISFDLGGERGSRRVSGDS